MSTREIQRRAWLAGVDPVDITPLAGDASFRRYFRVIPRVGQSLILMDAPPDKEDCQPFVTITKRLRDAGLHAPALVQVDLDQGFLLLEDLGDIVYLDRLYLDRRSPEAVETLYEDALKALVIIQGIDPRDLPPYDAALLQREMALFRDWFLERHLGIDLDPGQQGVLEEVFLALAEAALSQPRVFVHRDYHSRNLMVTAHHNPGVLDYQDAVWGPLTYDLVSLLRDCYIAWPPSEIARWALGFRDRLVAQGMLESCDDATFLRWFDLMGVQRHLKAIGIFARLNHRDGKPGYLQDIPRTLGYVIEISSRHAEIQPLYNLLSILKIPERLACAR